MVRKIVANQKGFTLVELLVVVAIIGVLVGTGVPSYRRMISKARKSEARIILGNVASAESAFFNEYNSYGNNIARMGADVEQAATAVTYTAGFNGVASATCTTLASGAAYGATPTGFFPSISAQFGAYNTQLGGRANLIGRTAQNARCVTGAATDVTATAYTAFASGYIGNNANAGDDCNGAFANCDVWTINQNRATNNTQDGVGL